MAVGGGLVYWLYSSGKLDLKQLGVAFEHHPEWVVLGWVAHLAMFLLLGARWLFIVRASGHGMSTWTAQRLNFTSHFFSSCLPGNGAGDLVKGWLASRQGIPFSSVLGTMALDRFCGMAGLFACWAICLWAALFVHPDYVSFFLPFAIFATVSALTILGLLLGSGRLLRRFHIAPTHEPTHWRAKLVVGARRMLTTIAMASENRGLVLRSFGISIVIQACYFATAYCVAIALEQPSEFVTMGALIPMVSLVNMIPLSPGGIGVGENAGAYLFEHMGYAPSAGATIILLVRLISITMAVIGSVAYMLGGRVGAMPDDGGASLAAEEAALPGAENAAAGNAGLGAEKVAGSGIAGSTERTASGASRNNRRRPDDE